MDLQHGGNQHWAVTNIGGNQYRIVGCKAVEHWKFPVFDGQWHIP